MNELTYKEVWNTLTQIDVSDYTDKKGNFTYLSWGVAWLELMKVYPQAQYEFLPEISGNINYVFRKSRKPTGNRENRPKVYQKS